MGFTILKVAPVCISLYLNIPGGQLWIQTLVETTVETYPMLCVSLFSNEIFCSTRDHLSWLSNALQTDSFWC